MRKTWPERGVDDEFLNLPLCTGNDATDAVKAKVDTWVLLSLLQLMEAMQQHPLALLPPQQANLDGLD